WGDGNTESFSGASLSHTYATQGTYTITVTASNVLGGTPVTESFEYATTPTPTPDFTIGQNGTADNSVDFVSIGGLDCYTYSWIFGDGEIASTENASHVYTANNTYDVVLLVENPNGQSASVTKQVTITGVGINEIDFTNGINVFPNPVSDVLNISFELNSAQDAVVELVSIDGRIVSSVSSNNTTVVNEAINTSKLSTGMYILNVTTDEGKFTKNIMVK
ncbi:MAG: PKD domain-containing protein, partial [Chitinophagales bacterium]